MMSISEFEQVDLDIRKAELQLINLKNREQRLINELYQFDVADRMNSTDDDENKQSNLEEN